MQHRNWHHDFEYSDNLFNKGIGTEEFFRAIEVALPPVVSRAELARLTGGLISAKTLSNEDALQKAQGSASGLAPRSAIPEHPLWLTFARN